MYYRSISFFCLFFLSLTKFFGPEKGFSEGDVGLYQITGLLIFFLTTIIINNTNNLNNLEIDKYLFLFFLIVIASSFLSVSFISIIYSSLFFINTLFIYSIFKDSSHSIIPVVKFAGIFLLFLMAIQLFLYGVDMGSGREVGNFEPNQFAILGLCSIALIFFSIKNIYIRILSLLIALFMIVATVSRGAMIVSLIFISTYTFIFSISNYTYRILFNYLSIFIIFSLTIFFLNYQYFNDLLYELFFFYEITSSGRGFDSGFTGRDVLWINALDQFTLHPLLGSGLRNFDLRSHSTYILLIVETGILGLLSFSLFLLNILFQGIKIVQQKYDDKINVSFSFILSMCFLGFIEKSVLLFTMPNSLLIFFFSSYIFFIKKTKINLF